MLNTKLPAPSLVPTLLYVEDDENAALLFRLSLEKCKPATKLFIVESCQKALNFLHRQTPFKEAPRPHLIVLDFNLPDGTGLHILEKIRAHEELAAMPAVFFSTAPPIAYRKRAAELGVLGFFSKPPDLSEFERIVENIHSLVPLAA